MGQIMQKQLRLGKIGFLNVLPIYHPLEAGIVPHPFTILSGTPSYLNGLMADGMLDVSVVSSIEYAKHPERYFILPDLSISCCGAVKSVLLLSRVPVEDLAGRKVLATTQSHTSVGLLKVLFSAHLGIDVRLTPGNCTESLEKGENPEAFLAIGDEALRLKDHPRYLYRWDLGEVWHRWTGLPFVFALWVIQRQSLERWNGALGNAVRALTSAKEWGLSHLEDICSEALKKGVLGMAELEDYYRALKFDLTDREQRGLERFYQYLAQIGEIGSNPRLEIYSPLACVA